MLAPRPSNRLITVESKKNQSAMTNPFLVPPPSSQDRSVDLPSEEGVAMTAIQRRTFLKRSGAATVATVLALNLNTAHAEEKKASGEGSWHKIMVDPINFGDGSTGSNDPDGCLHDEAGAPLGTPLPARKILELSVVAAGTEWAQSATSAMTITVTEHAQYQQDPVGNPNVWTDMTPAQFHAHRGGARDQHVKEASITKIVDGPSGIVTSTTKTPLTYNNSDENINITLAWSGDELSISFGSSDIVAETKTVEPLFHIKPFASGPPPEE